MQFLGAFWLGGASAPFGASAGYRQIDFWRSTAGEPSTIPAAIPGYVDWLKADSQKRVVLAEIEAYSGVPITRYISNSGFISRPSDAPANIHYEDLITAIPQFLNRMSEFLTGQSVPAWGDLEIDNSSGERDAWLNDAYDGRRITLYFGDPDWPKASFQKIMTGTVADIYAKNQRTLAFKMRDKQWMLNVPAQKNLIGGTTANRDTPIPLCYGQCFNVEPILIDSALSKYQAHDGAVNAIPAVYDSGLSVAFTPTLSAGTFVLTAAPAGRITCDVEGAKPAGVYLTTCADMIKHLVTTHTLLTDADLDLTSFSAFSTRCPQLLGLYVRERENLMPVLDSLITSVGGWYGFSRDGLMQLGRLEAPAAPAVVELTADDVVEGELRQIRKQLPQTAVRLGFRKNWTVQKDGLAGAVAEARRADLALEYLVSKAENTAILTEHPLASSPDVEGTLLVLEADADVESERRLVLYGVPRSTYALEGFSAPFVVTMGSSVKLTHPRLGFAAGAFANVVGISEQPTENRISLEIWK